MTATGTRAHGSRTTYVQGCRCEQCRAANRRYNKWRTMHGPADLVDAAVVRAHVEQLRTYGMGRRTIAVQAGVAVSVVSRLLGLDPTRPVHRVHRITANRLLAVQVQLAPDHALVDSTSTARRLRVLVAQGWPQVDLARRLGWSRAVVNSLIHQRTGQVTAATHLAVTFLFDDLVDVPGPSSHAAALAAQHGWAA